MDNENAQAVVHARDRDREAARDGDREAARAVICEERVRNEA